MVSTIWRPLVSAPRMVSTTWRPLVSARASELLLLQVRVEDFDGRVVD
jgi:hypothetical protein